MPKFEILKQVQKELEVFHQEVLKQIRKRFFSLGDYLNLVEKKKSELGEEGFEAWNAKFWSELDKDQSKYFSARGITR